MAWHGGVGPCATDARGVIHDFIETGEEFGEDRLKEVLRATVCTPADAISKRLADAMREWIGDAEQYDDLTFVVVAMNSDREATSLK